MSLSKCSAAPLLLHAAGEKIVDSSGRQVVLRGINLGGWLVEEPWMEPFTVDPPSGSPYPASRDHVSIWATARQRFGEQGMLRVRNAFRDNWITSADFDRIQAAGMNCVRLPFLAGIVDEPGGMQRLDQAVGWASSRGMYVILDMHGVPGGQSGEDHTGHVGTPTFFTDPKAVPAAMTIWAQIARHFAGNPAVAGYDLVNEPMASPTSDTLYVVYDRLYRAIRAVDPNHIIIIEDGYTGIQWMPFPVPAGWEDVVYSSHQYDFPAKSANDQQTSALDAVSRAHHEMDRRQIPWLIGEFGLEPNGTPDVLRKMLDSAAQSGIATTMWTYKAYWDKDGQQNLWGLYSNTKAVPPLNFFTDSEDQLVAKCAMYRTQNMTPNTGALDAFRAAARDSASQ